MLKFRKREDLENVRKNTLHAKRKREKKVSHSRQIIKENNNQQVMTNARLTVPHMHTGIFLKGKSTVSYHRSQGAKFNALNKARMNEKLTEILNLAKIPTVVPAMTYDKENVEDSKEYPLLSDVHDADTLSSDSSVGSLKNKHRRKLHEKQYVSLLSSEDTSEEEKEYDHKKHTENLAKYLHLKISQNWEKESEEDSKYVDFKTFLIYFDNNVSFKDSGTDFIAIEKGDLKRKRRKKSVTPTMPQNHNLKKKNMTKTHYFHTKDKEYENKSNEKSSKELDCPKIMRNIKIISPKRNPNYGIFQNRNPTKLTIINQIQGHSMNKEEENYLDKHKLLKVSGSENQFHNFKEHVTKTEQIHNLHNVEDYSEIRSSCSQLMHPEPISLLNPLNFLEITMSQPEPSQSHSLSNKTDPLDVLRYLKSDVPASSISAPPDICVSYTDETPIQNFPSSPFQQKAEQEAKSKTFYDIFKNNQMNEPLPSQVNSDSNFKNYYQHIFHEPKSILKTRFSEDGMFKFLEGKNSNCMPNCSQDFLILSPITSDGIDIEHSSSYPHSNESLSKVQRQLMEKTSSGICFDDESQMFTDSSRETYIFPSYHPKVNLSSISSNKETDIRANNFWHRRKMY